MVQFRRHTYPRRVIDAKVNPYHHVCVLDVLPPVCPRPHTGTASRLVGVLAAGVQLSVLVFGDIDVVVRKLGSLVVIAVLVRQHLLERGCVDLVGDRLAIDGIPHRRILNLEDPILLVVGIETTGLFDDRLLHIVTDTVRVEVVARHGVRFVIDKSVLVAVNGRVDSEGEDVLMVRSKDAWVDDSAPRHLDALVDGRSAEDPRGTDLVDELPGLIEHESQDVFVVGDSDDGLEHQLPIPDQGRSSGTLHGCQSNIER